MIEDCPKTRLELAKRFQLSAMPVTGFVKSRNRIPPVRETGSTLASCDLSRYRSRGTMPWD
ncbi:MAG: hypothetical protein MI862_14720 [Desulfobacterales bacterium]|nr:hypothetical protein [Desulfobacterales bacterium]